MPKLTSVLLISLIAVTLAAAAQPHQPEPFCTYEQASEGYVGYAISQSCQDGTCMMVQSWLRWEPSVIHVCAVEGEISRARLRLFKELPEDPDITVRLRGSEVAWPEREVVTVTSVFGESVDIAVDGTAALAAVDEDLGVAMVPITLEWIEAGEELTAEVWLAVHRGPCGLSVDGPFSTCPYGFAGPCLVGTGEDTFTVTLRNDYPVPVDMTLMGINGTLETLQFHLNPRESVEFAVRVEPSMGYWVEAEYWPQGWCHVERVSLFQVAWAPPETTPPETTNPPSTQPPTTSAPSAASTPESTQPPTRPPESGRAWVYVGLGAAVGGGVVALLVAAGRSKPKSRRRP